MNRRNLLFATFVSLHCMIAVMGILWIAEKALERQDRVCQEGCE